MLKGSPCVHTYSPCHQMIPLSWLKGPVVRGHLEPRIFQPTHASLKAAKSTQVWTRRGADRG